MCAGAGGGGVRHCKLQKLPPFSCSHMYFVVKSRFYRETYVSVVGGSAVGSKVSFFGVL